MGHPPTFPAGSEASQLAGLGSSDVLGVKCPDISLCPGTFMSDID